MNRISMSSLRKTLIYLLGNTKPFAYDVSNRGACQLRELTGRGALDTTVLKYSLCNRAVIFHAIFAEVERSWKDPIFCARGVRSIQKCQVCLSVLGSDYSQQINHPHTKKLKMVTSRKGLRQVANSIWYGTNDGTTNNLVLYTVRNVLGNDI